VIAGGGSDTVLLAAGFAAAITESISMGAVGYTSRCPSATTTSRDGARDERDRHDAAAERQEIRDIYAAKGFSGPCSRASSTRSRPPKHLLATMMDEELHLQPKRTSDIIRTAIVITIATLIGHLIRCCHSSSYPGRRR